MAACKDSTFFKTVVVKYSYKPENEHTEKIYTINARI